MKPLVKFIAIIAGLAVLTWVAGVLAQHLGQSRLAANLSSADAFLDSVRLPMFFFRLSVFGSLIYFARNIIEWKFAGDTDAPEAEELSVLTAKFRRSLFLVYVAFEAMYWATFVGAV